MPQRPLAWSILEQEHNIAKGCTTIIVHPPPHIQGMHISQMLLTVVEVEQWKLLFFFVPMLLGESN